MSSISKEQVEKIRDCLTIGLGNIELLLGQEQISEQGKERLRNIKREIWKIEDILET